MYRVMDTGPLACSTYASLSFIGTFLGRFTAGAEQTERPPSLASLPMHRNEAEHNNDRRPGPGAIGCPPSSYKRSKGKYWALIRTNWK